MLQRCVILAVMLPLLASCDDSISNTPVTFQLTPAQQREMALIKLAEQFANHVVAGEYDEAYALTSQRLRDEMDFDAFVAQHEAALAEHGKPLAAHWDMTMPPVTLESEYTGFDESTPLEERAARMGLHMALEMHERDETLVKRWFYCWINIVQDPAASNDPESGRREGDAIDSFDYAPASVHDRLLPDSDPAPLIDADLRDWRG